MDEPCVWTMENADECVWKPGCGADLFVFNVGGPRENHFTFCPYCGGLLDAVLANVDQDDDLECPCCGDVGAEPTKDGYYDGQALTCGCPGHVCVEEDDESAWINNGDEPCLKCDTKEEVCHG